MSQYKFKLFISGETANSAAARATVERLCEVLQIEACAVRIIDVLEEPDMAETDRVIATPTLIRTSPKPERRVIGDLTDINTILTAMRQADPATPPELR